MGGNASAGAGRSASLENSWSASISVSDSMSRTGTDTRTVCIGGGCAAHSGWTAWRDTPCLRPSSAFRRSAAAA